MIRQYMKNGIARLENCQVTDLGSASQEVFILGGEIAIPLALGKNANNIIDKLPPMEKLYVEPRGTRLGPVYYWYTTPLHNYYHCILDGVGQLARYFALKSEIPELQFMLNPKPRPKGGVTVHPPFVTELLELFDIEYEYTDETIMYDTVYFADTLGQDQYGKRVRPADLQYKLLQQLIDTAKQRANAPQYERVYLSRRAHANPINNRKDVIGEDNTVKRGLTNEDEVVEILSALGFTEVFGENYNLAEKIVLFNGMNKYISTAGAGITNILWTMPNEVSVGGIHTPGFPFPGPQHGRNIVVNKKFVHADISIYPGQVVFEDPQPTKGYNHPWRIDNLDAFSKWAITI